MPAETADQTAWVLDRARRLAADVLGPAAMTVEATQRVPREHLDLLAAAGFYGLAGPARRCSCSCSAPGRPSSSR
jgi:alkylation response protein AidB-like acyl-CoA dehydrogenase